MKQLRQILILTLIATLAGSVQAATLTLDNVPSQAASRHISVPVAADISLDAVEYLVRLSGDERASSLEITVVEKSPHDLGMIVPADQTTSDGDYYDTMLSTKTDADLPGHSALHIAGVIELAGTRYARLLHFPVTIDSLGQGWFNRSVTIRLGDRELTQNDLIEPESLNLEASRKERSSSFISASAAAGPEYVIITSAGLVDVMTLLATYKNETGYVTELKLIDDILGSQSGVDDAEKLREYLKQFYTDGGQYVLLAGDESVLPIRYAYNRRTSGQPDLHSLQICDLYFADLTGDWDTDGDGVWGEPYDDQPDLVPELRVGRLPINSVDEALNYVAKLIRYETNPGNGDASYLEKAFFFSSDQMRDYSGGGQHGRIASSYPNWFDIDTVTGVEASTGFDPAPVNTPPTELQPYFYSGYGIINIIAHGRSDGFVVKSAGYNAWPKSYMLTERQSGAHGSFDSLMTASKPGFYYSLACDNGGFDMDHPEFGHENPLVVQMLIGSFGGAVGFVAYSRWGWISSSYLLQQTFFDSLFAHPELPAVEAMYASKAKYYYLRDLVYGQNFHGDPTLKVHTQEPDRPLIDALAGDNGMDVTITIDGNPVSDCRVILAESGMMLAEYITDAEGWVLIDYPFNPLGDYKITAVQDGALISQVRYLQSMVTDVDDEPTMLPESFELYQNFPNPFNPTTVITFNLPRAGQTTVEIYNLLGQRVITLIDDLLGAGEHRLTWNSDDHSGNPVASGTYFYRLTTEDQSSVKKMILLR